ncbi:hypothetical protein L342_4244 [Escherichia coli CE516]|nr:hypothetical protein L342_4244 [Escherichia coli CE516]
MKGELRGKYQQNQENWPVFPVQYFFPSNNSMSICIHVRSPGGGN